MRVLSLLGFLLIYTQSLSQIWINEIHYDNSGADINECIELAGLAGTDLSCYRIILYNGSDGASYLNLTPSGTIDNESCGYGALSFCVSSSQSIQNGNPDGIALYNTCTSSLTQFLSYGGTFTATNGLALGATSVNIGQTEGGSISNSSLQLIGTGNQYSDFTWQDESSTISSSFGSINSGQSFCISTNTISTSNLSSTSFTVDCSTGASGSIDFTSTGTFNAGNTFTVQLSNASGSFTSPTNLATSVSASGTDPSGTINFVIPANTTAGTGYRIRVISSNPSVTSPDNGTNITIVNNPCTITTGAISGGPFSISCLDGMDGSVAFASDGTFSTGNEFIVQLSNASGSFSSPTTIGSLDSTLSVGTDPSGNINFSIPAGLPSGNYIIRIISTDPSLTGSNSSTFTITLTDGPCSQISPYFTSAIINSCNPTCQEGHNELVFGNTGDYSVLVNSSNFNMSYGSTFPLTNYTDVLVTNTATTSAINTAAGCPGNFIEGTGATLPPGSSFIIASTYLCIDALSWSGLCGAGPIYIIYQDDPDWNLNGNFKNGDTGGVRYFNSTMTTTSGETFSIDYNYNSTDLQSGLAGDGDFVSWSPNGGQGAYGDNNCILTPVLLPSTTINFEAVYNNGSTHLSWQTQSEQNNDHFTILHSQNGYDFTPIGNVNGAGNSSSNIHYSFVHNRPSKGINYYKLTSTDYDGTRYNKGIVSVMVESSGTYYDAQTSQLLFGEVGDYNIYALDGKLLGSVENGASLPFDNHGMILIQDLKTGRSERLFVP